MRIGKAYLSLLPADGMSEEELNDLRSQVRQGRWKLMEFTGQHGAGPVSPAQLVHLRGNRPY